MLISAGRETSLVPILTHLPCLLLQEPDLLSDHCQFAAGICSDKVIGLGEKIRAAQDGKNHSPLECAEPAVVKLKTSTELGGAGAVLAPPGRSKDQELSG